MTFLGQKMMFCIPSAEHQEALEEEEAAAWVDLGLLNGLIEGSTYMARWDITKKNL